MKIVRTLAKREFAAYFATPLAYVFLVAFVAASGAMTFYVGDFMSRGQADLAPFFMFHPWLFLALIPAIGMRLWAEERRSGTMELLLTLPVTTGEAVLGKFLAGWLFAGLALALTFPMWLTVNWLGAPDNGVIFASYVGSFLLAGAMLAAAAFASALTRNQVIAFILGIGLCMLLIVSGVGAIAAALRGILPGDFAEALSSASMLTRFASISRGVLDLRDLFYFVSVIGLFLFLNVCVVELERSA